MVRRHRPHSRIRRRLPPGVQASRIPIHGGEPYPPLAITGGWRRRYRFEVPAVVDLTAQKRHRLEVSVAADAPTRSAVLRAERLGLSPRVDAAAVLRGWKQYLHVVVRGGSPPRAQLACGTIHRR